MAIYLKEIVHHRQRDESHSEECNTFGKRILVFAGDEQGGCILRPSWDEQVPGGDISVLATATRDNGNRVRPTTQYSQKQPSGKEVDTVNLDMELPVPRCPKHAGRDDLVQMHCDTDYKNVRVSHFLEVRVLLVISISHELMDLRLYSTPVHFPASVVVLDWLSMSQCACCHAMLMQPTCHFQRIRPRQRHGRMNTTVYADTYIS